MQLAGDEAIGKFAGLILGTMMGPTIVFTIPVALGIIDKKDRGYLGAGVPAGMITIPIGCIVGGLWFHPGRMIRGFNRFGIGVTVVIAALTAIAVFEQITGIMFPLFDRWQYRGHAAAHILCILQTGRILREAAQQVYNIMDDCDQAALTRSLNHYRKDEG